jgi:hypothetical protein
LHFLLLLLLLLLLLPHVRSAASVWATLTRSWALTVAFMLLHAAQACNTSRVCPS